MLVRSIVLIVSLGCVTATVPRAAFAQTESKSLALKSPSDFESIGDQAERSRAIFVEIGKLLTHPRCMNCHPAGNHPLQGADHHEHMPPVWRSDADTSAPIAQSVTPTTMSHYTRPPLIRAFPAILAGVSRHCRWLGKAKL
jgi:hypothetical protein